MSADKPAWQHWREQQRVGLLAARGALPASHRDALDGCLLHWLLQALPSLAGSCLGLYWPVRGEPDLRRLADLPGVRAALPVVIRRDAPVEFHAWSPGEPLRAAGFGVQVPARAKPMQPDVVIVPLLGFDAAGYRLGYGSGCYDRSLAAARPPPLAVGVGYELGRLPSIRPRWHDVPMDLLITESGLHRPLRDSPPLAAEESA